MHIEPRLLIFTQGVRARIGATVAVGLLGVAFGVARLFEALVPFFLARGIEGLVVRLTAKADTAAAATPPPAPVLFSTVTRWPARQSRAMSAKPMLRRRR